MNAARYHGPQDVRVEDVPEADPGPTDVRVDVAACGICGTDLHEYRDGPIFIPTEPHPTTGETLPITLGHEFTGIVSKTGENVSRLRTGDRVVVHPNIPCHECPYCEEGNYNRCPDAAAIGLQTGTGGFAERAVVPEQQVHHLPDEVSLEAGALVEPLAVGVHAVRRSGVQTGDTVAVFGAGPIGLATVRAASAAGAKRVFVSEPAETRRAVAMDIGADEGIDPLATDPVERITSGTVDGVDVAFEFAGLEQTVDAAVRSTKRGGTIVVGSVWGDSPRVDLNEIVGAERSVRGTNCYGFPPLSFRSEFDAVIQELAAGTIDPDPFITGTIALENIVPDGFEALLDGGGEHVKILVEP